MKYLSEEDEQFVAEDFQGPPGSKPPVRSSALLDASWKCNNGDTLESLSKLLEHAKEHYHSANMKLREAEHRMIPLRDEERVRWHAYQNIRTRLNVWKLEWDEKHQASNDQAQRPPEL